MHLNKKVIKLLLKDRIRDSLLSNPFTESRVHRSQRRL